MTRPGRRGTRAPAARARVTQAHPQSCRGKHSRKRAQGLRQQGAHIEKGAPPPPHAERMLTTHQQPSMSHAHALPRTPHLPLEAAIEQCEQRVDVAGRLVVHHRLGGNAQKVQHTPHIPAASPYATIRSSSAWVRADGTGMRATEHRCCPEEGLHTQPHNDQGMCNAAARRTGCGCAPFPQAPPKESHFSKQGASPAACAGSRLASQLLTGGSQPSSLSDT